MTVVSLGKFSCVVAWSRYPRSGAGHSHSLVATHGVSRPANVLCIGDFPWPLPPPRPILHHRSGPAQYRAAGPGYILTLAMW